MDVCELSELHCTSVAIKSINSVYTSPDFHNFVSVLSVSVLHTFLTGRIIDMNPELATARFKKALLLLLQSERL